MYVQVHYLLSFSLIFNVLGTFLIVREIRVVLCSTSPMLTGVPRCPKLQIWSDTTSSVLSAMPWRYLVYMSSFSTRRLPGSSKTETENRDSRLVSSFCTRKSTLQMFCTSILCDTQKNNYNGSVSCNWEERTLNLALRFSPILFFITRLL